MAQDLGHDNMGLKIEWSKVAKGWDVIPQGLGHYRHGWHGAHANLWPLRTWGLRYGGIMPIIKHTQGIEHVPRL
jgi:hypothetical protein